MQRNGSAGLVSEQLRAFLTVAQTLNFREAARRLKIGQSTVSRHVTELEDMLGVRLFHRSTRAVVITEAGLLFQTKCEALALGFDSAEQAVRAMADTPSGHLVVHVPAAFGRLHVAPLLHDFMAACPGLSVELILSDEYSPFDEDRIDVGIRIGRLESGNLIARKIADNRRQICAAPAYLARRGVPQHPRHLVEHALLEFTPLRTAGTWQFIGPDAERLVIKLASHLRSNNAEVLRQAAIDGAGIVALADFIVAPDIAAGRLVPVMSAWRVPDTAIHIVYPDRVMLPTKTRSFVDFIAARFRDGLPWETRA
jgi:DNA-binding transcriptional LysR family regulator